MNGNPLELCADAGHVIQNHQPWMVTICITCNPSEADPCWTCWEPRFACCC